MPGAVASASYDAANQLLNWNGIGLSYDANGNMLSDGSNLFTWNARNQVASLNNVSLQYDAFGRRTKNLAGTSFLYNGANAVQELSGSTVTANLLSGGVDEIFSRTDSSGALTQLKDALGSTIALADYSGNVQTSYIYDPYGNTSVTGTSNANEFQYTGRENEGNGLYYYRARYYSPVLHRFISEDPLGFAGSGPNLYAYVFNNPTNLSDPRGLSPDGGGGAPVMEPPVEEPPVVAPAPPEIPSSVPEPPVAPTPPGTVPFCVANSEVCVGAVGVAATGAIVYYGGSATVAVMHENAAYDELMQAEHNLNQIYLAQSLAGRNCEKGNVDKCNEREAREINFCKESFADWSPELYRLCLIRAKARKEACIDGLPDPGPLNPLDPDWSID